MAHDLRYFDIVVIVPLQEEWHTVSSVFGFIEDLSTDNATRHVVESGHPEISMMLVLQDDMGKDAAYHATFDVLTNFRAGLLVCLGIAGSLHSDMKLGDVCYTGTVLDVYNNTKQADIDKASTKGVKTHFSPEIYSTPTPLVRAITKVRIAPDLKRRYEIWQRERTKAALLLKVEDGSLLTKLYKELLITDTREAAIACASVSDSRIYNSALKELDRRIAAIETEAGGVFSVAAKHEVPALEIRGISDYAENKGLLEQSTKGLVRQLAAENAATFLRFQIQNADFRRIIKSGSFAKAAVQELDGQSLSQIIGAIADGIYARIKELSQEYRVQPKGYRLPLPRIRSQSLGMGAPDGSMEPMEIRNAVSTRRFTPIQVPRTYPDGSLPYVIADDIFNLENLNKQCIPIVVNADELGPPKGTLKRAWPDHVDKHDNGSIQIIYILHNLPFSSTSRMSFIKEEISKHDDAKFIILFSDDIAALRRSEMSGLIGSEAFSLCSTSFLEITYFVQKNFEMSGSEAEVIALRLRETFERYGLSAHPTYFAGLPRPALAGLLQANRRGELIQIAVDGYLSYVVLKDNADIKITRSTRLRFLGLLASEIHVERRSFSKIDLVLFAENLSVMHDWGIDALSFVQSFLDRGILEERNDKVVFTLPFVEAYALAKALVDDDIRAMCFFDGAGTEMEATVLDLYAELKPSSHVVDDIIAKIQKETDNLEIDGIHVLLNDSIRPILLQKPERLESLRKRVKTAGEQVIAGKSDSGEKQRLLDLMEKAKEQMRSTPVDGESEYIENSTLAGKLEKLNPALQAWSHGNILLGSGAEHLKGELKRQLIKMLLTLGTRLIHFATVAVSEMDFAKVKADLLKTVEKQFRESDNFSADNRPEEQIDAVVDLMEYMCLMTPIVSIMHRLCENARMKMVGTSLEMVSPESDLDRILHAAWFSDVNVSKGRILFTDTVKSVKISEFMRTTLVSHILTRVRWSHSDPEERLKLLEVADTLLEPVGKTWNKDPIVRMLKKEKREASQAAPSSDTKRKSGRQR